MKTKRRPGRPNLTDDVLSLLVDYRAPSRILCRRLNGSYQREWSGYDLSPEVLRATLSRLKKIGLLEQDDSLWQLTKRGLARIKDPLNSHRKALPASEEKNMIVMFDIPERDKKKRAWLRAELALRGFTMLQKSVWFGPGPLPKEFIKNLDTMRILHCLRFFTAKESDIA